MLPLVDAQVRLVLLNHVTVSLAEAEQGDLEAAGIEREQLARLSQMSALDLNRLAAMRDLTIGVAFDAGALKAGRRGSVRSRSRTKRRRLRPTSSATVRPAR